MPIAENATVPMKCRTAIKAACLCMFHFHLHHHIFLAIMLPVLRFTASDYHFDIFIFFMTKTIKKHIVSKKKKTNIVTDTSTYTAWNCIFTWK